MNTTTTISGRSIVRCAWLLNPGFAPRRNVRLTIEGGFLSEIVDVPPDEESLVQPIAVFPQFVNAHTHLEFSNLQEPLEPSDPFPDWIKSVIGYRLNNPSEKFVADSVEAGLLESASSGVGLIGEITTSDVGHQALKQAGAQVVSFREFIGFSRTSADAQLEIASTISQQIANGKPATGFSPHAPYSVHPELFEGIVDLAVESNSPVAMHLAETRDEVELLSHRSGRFVDFLEQLNLWDSAALGQNRSVLPYLEKLAQCRHSLAIHCNYLTDSEIRFLGNNTNVAVVYCPRTHHWFGHPLHPLKKLVAAGATVILGTDSRASNPDLCIWKELQFVANLAGAKPIWELLPMITTQAASAMGKPPSEFSIAVGRRFRATAISCECDQRSKLNDELTKPRCRTVDIFR